MPIIKRALARFWQGPAATVCLSTVYPTLFVLSQNWYALNAEQVVWLLAVMPVAGLAIYGLVEGLFRLAAARSRRSETALSASDIDKRATVFGLVCSGLVFFLLYRTFKVALGSNVLLTLAYLCLAAIFVFALRRGWYRHVNGFLAIASLVAVSSWTFGALDGSQSWLGSAKQDFEGAAFKRKPNVYLFIYDGYGSESLYRKVFDIDNGEQYRQLAARGFKVLQTFSNYRDTIQTTIAVFLGAHHYYSTSTGFADTQKGRPFLSGIVHNPVLSTFKNNGYRLQYIHSLDYFVNEQGILDYMFPPKPVASALRVFDVQLLKMKRKFESDVHKKSLYSHMRPPASATGQPWFTFAHVNRPSHADLAVHWSKLGNFPQQYGARTAEANTHMLETVDRIRATDPEAVIIIFGDHGSQRYNKLWVGADPNVEFAKAGIPVETMTLDQFGITIAIASAGACDDYVFEGLSPVNMMRTVFACLAEDRGLLAGKAEDISLLRGMDKKLWRASQDGKILPAWMPYSPPARAPQ